MPDVQTLPEHYGLAGMEERAMMIGAYLHIDTKPGKGTRVTLHVKL
jgi:signal transduction histidine kinase